MRLKTVVKLGTMVSVLLFVLAMGYYALMRLDTTGHNREVNLFSLVPSDCVGVLESNDVKALFDECPNLNYSRELAGFQFPGLFGFLIEELNNYTNDMHGLSHEMNRLLVSFHHPGTSLDQVVYFRMGMADNQLLSDVLQEYMPGNFMPKEEAYRGKKMLVYPLYEDKFLVVYAEEDFVVLSYQKRLVEGVIDAKLDETSLSQDALFQHVLEKKKAKHSLRLYGRSASLPFLHLEPGCWSEYEFHLNSDVLYLMGETYMSEHSSDMETVKSHLQDVPVVKEERIIISAEKDSTALYMDQAFEMNDGANRNLFNECVANLAEETAFTLVADMEEVKETPELFRAYLPPYILENVSLLRPFVLSVQLSLNGDRLSHMWVFTYKN